MSELLPMQNCSEEYWFTWKYGRSGRCKSIASGSVPVQGVSWVRPGQTHRSAPTITPPDHPIWNAALLTLACIQLADGLLDWVPFKGEPELNGRSNPMWNFVAREANWTEIVTNTLALGFSLMAIVVIAYSVMVRPEILAAVGSVTSGITGVILGFYFNRERLKSAQKQAAVAVREHRAVSEEERETDLSLERLLQAYNEIVIQLDLARSDLVEEEEEKPHDS